ncbi:hypothetical protein N7467_002451 [Penicillium canescens]|nr:hypothetical protein N7467_002451 [Penicillium canescens]
MPSIREYCVNGANLGDEWDHAAMTQSNSCLTISIRAIMLSLHGQGNTQTSGIGDDFGVITAEKGAVRSSP